ncbi:MAG: 3-deoxy-8-phosphooctulonate synthase, partial [bacterium]|nr:3-deoxy-8-phosphooctulonate synthase [bacterium]
MRFNYTLHNLELKSGELFFILGPCVIENESFTLDVAEQLKQITAE